MFKNSATTNVWGFKEIRYDSGNIQYISDFKELFPQTRVIVQIRENIRQQSKSGWFNNDKSAVDFLQKNSRELIEFANKNKEWLGHSKEQSSRLNGMFQSTKEFVE